MDTPVTPPVNNNPVPPGNPLEVAKPVRRLHWMHKLLGVVVLVIAAVTIYFMNKPGGQVIPNPSISPTPSTSSGLSVGPTIIVTPPFSNNRSWQVKLDTVFFSLEATPAPGQEKNTVMGKLYSPLNSGEYVCRHADPAESMFLEKQQNSKWVRLCDQAVPTNTNRQLSCEKYDSDNGIPVSATLYPVNDCQSTTPVIGDGYYRVHGRVYTGCTVSSESAEGKKCTGIVEVYSPQFSVGK